MTRFLLTLRLVASLGMLDVSLCVCIVGGLPRVSVCLCVGVGGSLLAGFACSEAVLPRDGSTGALFN